MNVLTNTGLFITTQKLKYYFKSSNLIKNNLRHYIDSRRSLISNGSWLHISIILYTNSTQRKQIVWDGTNRSAQAIK